MQDMTLKIKFCRMRKFLGLYYYGKDLIKLHPKQSESEMVKTLIHEFIHFVMDKVYKRQLFDGSGRALPVANCKSLEAADTDEENALCRDIEEYAGRKIHEFLVARSNKDSQVQGDQARSS